MKKLFCFNRITLDGFFAGPNGEIDWFIHDTELDKLTHAIMDPDTLLLGRVTYDMFVNFWPAVGPDPNAPQELKKIAAELDEMTKIVFTKTLKHSDWQNTRLVTDDPIQYVKSLKQGPGRDIVIFGSGTIVQQLAGARLIDEYLLAVTPVALGKGKPQFQDVAKFNLELVKSHSFKTGNILLDYRLANNPA